MRARVERERVRGRLDPVDEASLEHAYLPLAAQIAESVRGASSPRFIPVVGAPGSGKSTLVAYLEVMLQVGFDLRIARFGIDDVYLGRAERERLAETEHPLFANRGAPGTHHVKWYTDTLSSLRLANEASSTPLPRFDKVQDDTVPQESWPRFVGRPDVILFDTWLWEFEPPTPESLLKPINRTEAEQDPDGVWRTIAAGALRERYLTTFSGADKWVLFEPPSWEATVRFREEQDANRLRRLPPGQRPMPERGLRFFLELFERWLCLPHRTAPDHRIVLDEKHSARLIG